MTLKHVAAEVTAALHFVNVATAGVQKVRSLAVWLWKEACTPAALMTHLAAHDQQGEEVGGGGGRRGEGLERAGTTK